MLNAYSKLLCVDDEPEILVSLKRLFRGTGLQIDTADGGKEALSKINISDYDVIISDMRMPEMDGATFLQQAHERQPSAKRILLTGYADQDSTIRAINNGKIFSYINKPWSNDDLREVVMSAIAEKYAEAEISLVTEDSLQEKDELTLEKIQLITQMEATNSELELANFEADSTKKELTQSHHNTIKTLFSLSNSRVTLTRNFNEQIILQSVLLAKKLSLKDQTVREIRYGAYLYQVGKITLPETIINTPYHQLNEQERELYEQYPDAGADILEPLGFLPQTAEIVRQHRRNYDTIEINSSGRAINPLPIGARILRIVTDFNALISGFYSHTHYSKQDALGYLKSFAGKKYDPSLVNLFEKLMPTLEQLKTNLKEQALPYRQLAENMIVSRDIASDAGILLVAKGTRLTHSIIETLYAHQKQSSTPLHFFVLKQPAATASHNY